VYIHYVGVGQLASFIEVCHSTAEEEFNMNRLAFLHSVGTEFASLIYDFPDNSGFEKLDEKCCTVWSFLKKNPRLAGSLVRLVVGKHACVSYRSKCFSMYAMIICSVVVHWESLCLQKHTSRLL